MEYHCKKCGAIVTGKYCSCCGKCVTSDLRDFRLAEARARKAFVNGKYRNEKSDLSAMHIASLAFEIAFEKLVPQRYLEENFFYLAADKCWRKLAECDELADILYDGMMRVCFPERID